MNATECAYWNARVRTFYVTAHSYVSGRTIQVGKPHSTIEAALAAAKRLEAKRSDGQMLFIDSKRPS